MSLYKKNILFIVIFTLCAFVSASAFVWIVDPFHIYHRDTWINKDKYIVSTLSTEFNIDCLMRKFNDFDLVVQGKSTSGCFVHSDLLKACKAHRVLPLLIRSDSYTLLKKVLGRFKIKTVVILNPSASSVVNLNTNKKWSVTLFHAFVSSCKLISSYFSVKLKKRWCRSVDKIHYWYPDETPFTSSMERRENRAVIDQYRSRFGLNPTTTTESFLSSIIKSHPEITFHLLYFPSLSLPSNNLLFDNQIPPNVRIYMFFDVPHAFILHNWVDFIHFSPVFNKFMTYCIEHNLHRVTAENYEAYKQHVRDVLRSFNPSDYPDRPTTFEELVAYEESLHPELKKQKVTVEKP